MADRRGIEVTDANGDRIWLYGHATTYTVNDSGELIISDGDTEMARYAAGAWTSVERVGSSQTV